MADHYLQIMRRRYVFVLNNILTETAPHTKQLAIVRTADVFLVVASLSLFSAGETRN